MMRHFSQCGRSLSEKTLSDSLEFSKKTFHLFAWPIMLHSVLEIVEAFYCCLILHNIAVVERVTLNDGSIESNDFYEIVARNDDDEVLPNRQNTEVLHFVQLEE